jgi:hypothetical protein
VIEARKVQYFLTARRKVVGRYDALADGCRKTACGTRDEVETLRWGGGERCVEQEPKERVDPRPLVSLVGLQKKFR